MTDIMLAREVLGEVFRPDGKPVGLIVNYGGKEGWTWLEKKVRPGEHEMHRPNGWAIATEHIIHSTKGLASFENKGYRIGGVRVTVTDKETGETYGTYEAHWNWWWRTNARDERARSRGQYNKPLHYPGYEPQILVFRPFWQEVDSEHLLTGAPMPWAGDEVQGL